MVSGKHVGSASIDLGNGVRRSAFWPNPPFEKVESQEHLSRGVGHFSGNRFKIAPKGAEGWQNSILPKDHDLVYRPPMHEHRSTNVARIGESNPFLLESLSDTYL